MMYNIYLHKQKFQIFISKWDIQIRSTQAFIKDSTIFYIWGKSQV